MLVSYWLASWATSMSQRPMSFTSRWRTTASPGRTAWSGWPSSSCGSWRRGAAARLDTRWSGASPWTTRDWPSPEYSPRGPTTKWPKSLCVWSPKCDLPKKCHKVHRDTPEGPRPCGLWRWVCVSFVSCMCVRKTSVGMFHFKVQYVQVFTDTCYEVLYSLSYG